VKVFGTEAEYTTYDEDVNASSLCSGMGLSLMAGLMMMGLMLVKL